MTAKPDANFRTETAGRMKSRRGRPPVGDTIATLPPEVRAEVNNLALVTDLPAAAIHGHLLGQGFNVNRRTVGRHVGAVRRANGLPARPGRPPATPSRIEALAQVQVLCLTLACGGVEVARKIVSRMAVIVGSGTGGQS